VFAAMAWCGCLALAGVRMIAAPSTVPYFIADGTGAPGFRSGDRQLALWALDNWARAAPGIRFEPSSESNALVRLYWNEANQGLYGEMQPLIVAGRHGGAVFIQADATVLGDEISRRANQDPLFRDTVVYLTCLHELGHALGLSHTADFRDIMYFFGFGGDTVEYFNRYRMQLHARSDIARVSGLSASDARRLVISLP
jgi:hypothetical protein